MMQVKKITRWADLGPYRQRWDELAGDCIFRGWDWQSTWWRHYGAEHELFVLLVLDAEQLVAVLPCYLESHFARGRVLRLLGDGEICSDHLDVLGPPAEAGLVGEVLARYLCETNPDWDSTDFTAIGSHSVGIHSLHQAMGELGCSVTLTPNQNVWSVPLPATWEAFLSMQSKSHRKQLRRAEKRVLDTEQAEWQLVESPEQFAIAWPILLDLHQRRRISQGEPGCFASTRWAAFHQEVARRLLDTGKLRLSWLELNGQPVAAEYHFAGQQTTWAYQGGVEPDRIDEEPGRLSMIRTFQRAIAERHQQFDLLRGDETYKAHWRAEPLETFDIQIVPPRNTAVWRSQACGYVAGAARFARELTKKLNETTH